MQRILLLQSRSRSSGFSITALIVILMIAITASVALAVRGGSGLLSAALDSQSREARDVAEAGLTAVISELNKKQNRRMLVSGLSPATWATTPDARQQNPCLQLGAATTTLSSARSLAGNSEQNLVSDDTNRRFILKTVRYTNKDRSVHVSYSYGSSGTTLTTSGSSTSFNNASNQLINLANVSPVNDGYLELTVEGRVYRGGNLVAVSRATREYRVVPKCCSRSFYGPSGSLGVDGRLCFSGDSNTGRLGIVTGFNGGGVDSSGAAGSLVDAQGDQLQAILCITQATVCGDPTSSVTVSSGSVPVIPAAIDIRVPPSYPAAAPSSSGVINPSGGSAKLYIRANAAGTALELCTPSTSSGTVNAVSSCSGLSYCVKLVNDYATYHCYMRTIQLTGNQELYVDTTGGPIAFYFEASTGSGAGTVSTGGTTGIYHRYCSSYQANGCNTKAPLSEFQRLAFYGSLATNSFSLGGTPEGFSFFVYFRNGTISVTGTANAEGALWSNRLDLTGNFRVAAPPTGCTSSSGAFCSLIGGGTSPEEILFDWVARSTSQARSY